jgi:hypothetical protein
MAASWSGGADPLTFGLIFMEQGRFDNGGHSLFPSDGNKMK